MHTIGRLCWNIHIVICYGYIIVNNINESIARRSPGIVRQRDSESFLSEQIGHLCNVNGCIATDRCLAPRSSRPIADNSERPRSVGATPCRVKAGSRNEEKPPGP